MKSYTSLRMRSVEHQALLRCSEALSQPSCIALPKPCSSYSCIVVVLIQADRPVGYEKGAKAAAASDSLAAGIGARLKQALQPSSSVPLKCAACRAAGDVMPTEMPTTSKLDSSRLSG